MLWTVSLAVSNARFYLLDSRGYVYISGQYRLCSESNVVIDGLPKQEMISCFVAFPLFTFAIFDLAKLMPV